MSISAHKNFAISTLASPPSGTGGTSLTVGSGHGTLFPAVPFNVTVWPTGVTPTSSKAEIMRVTAKASDVFTVTRAQEGTSARTFSANDQIAATITARTLTDAEYSAFGIVSITDPQYGAIGDGDGANAATNVTAIRAARDAAKAAKKNLYIPSGTYVVNDNVEFDGDCSNMTVFGDGPSSCLQLHSTMAEGANVECGWTIIMDGASNGTLTNFRLTGIRVDGNRTGIVGFDAGNTCNLIVGYQDSDFENVQVDNCIAHSALQGSGFLTFAGGIRFIDCISYDNGYHGGACSRNTTFGDADKVAEWHNFTTHDNGQSGSSGYGFDAGQFARTIVTNLNSYWNYEGGLKFSIGTEYLKVNGARLAYNLGPGFQDTDTPGTITAWADATAYVVGDLKHYADVAYYCILAHTSATATNRPGTGSSWQTYWSVYTTGNAVLDLDAIVTHNNGNVGFRVVSGSRVRIGSVVSYDNYCRSGASRSGDSYTGGSLQGADFILGASDKLLRYLDAGRISSVRSPAAGILLDGNILSYRVGYAEAREAETYGYRDSIQGSYAAWADSTAYALNTAVSYSGSNYICISTHTSVLADNRPGTGATWQTKWELLGDSEGVLEGGLMVANNQAAGANAAILIERTGAMKIRNIIFRDHQTTPTQTTGMTINSACKADIDYCHFGTGISAGSEITSGTAGTVVRFGHNNTGTLVTRARGSFVADGGATTASVTFPTAISNLGGLVYFVNLVPASVNAAVPVYVTTLNRTTLTVTRDTGNFGGGAGDLTFYYDVQAEIQR